MIMTDMLEWRMQNMCNLSELVEERATKRERIEAKRECLKLMRQMSR